MFLEALVEGWRRRRDRPFPSFPVKRWDGTVPAVSLRDLYAGERRSSCVIARIRGR